MRKLILISALVLASATAQAATTRGLVLAANDQAAIEPATEAVKDAAKEQPSAPVQDAAPKYVARPAAVETPAAPPQTRPAPEKTATAVSLETSKPETVRVEKPRRRHSSTEARVIYELHRHGIYW